MQSLPKIQSPDRIVNQVQTNVQNALGSTNNALQALQAVSLMGGQMLTGVALTAATSLVPHTLKRAYVGWLVIDNTASASIYRDTTSAAPTNQVIALKASANTTVNIWIF